jgi:uncharacterized protein (UPF0147 family)
MNLLGDCQEGASEALSEEIEQAISMLEQELAEKTVPENVKKIAKQPLCPSSQMSFQYDD